MRVNAKLKCDLLIGWNEIYPIHEKNVVITDYEDNKLYGRRYKIEGDDDWFEENSFEYINQDALSDELL